MVRIGGLVSLIYLIGLSSLSLQAEEKPSLPKAVAVLGDSISEAMLVNFSLEHPPTVGQLITMYSVVNDSLPGQIIQAFRRNYAVKQHSWATGDDSTDLVQSHLERLRALDPSVRGFNFAVSGAQAKDLSDQVDTLEMIETGEQVSMDYVMLLIGANDLGTDTLEEMTSPNEFIGHIETSLRRLLDRESRRSILIVELPNILQVFEESASHRAYSVLGVSYNCDEIRKKIYGEKTILFHPENTRAYEAARVMMDMYRQGQRSLIERLKVDYPRAFMKVVPAYENPSTAVKVLSIDCFHPSYWGQAILSEQSWLGGFWPSMGDEFEDWGDGE